MPEEPIKQKYSISTIIITSVVIVIILVLAGLLYYFATKPIPPAPQEFVPVQKNPEPVAKEEPPPPPPPVVPTNMVNFSPPETLSLPEGYPEKSGKCFASSIAAPFRQDAFRCMVGNAIYDPCFNIDKKGFVYCQVGIDESTGFLMKLTQALPKVTLPATAQDNWAWYVKLKDGTLCSPFTGTRPIFGEQPNMQAAYYGCKSDNKDEQVVLLGDLTRGEVWTANKAILTKLGGAPAGSWTIKSSVQTDVDTVWQ